MFSTPGGRMRAAISPMQQRRQRRRRRRFQHHRVAGEQARPQLVGQEDDREIPRRDGGDHAQRHARLDHLAGGIFGERAVRQVERSDGAQDARRFVHFEIRAELSACPAPE